MAHGRLVNIRLDWREAGRKECEFLTDAQLLVNHEWLVDINTGEITRWDGMFVYRWKPSGDEEYPLSVSYVSAQLCDPETRDRFLDNINFNYIYTESYMFEVSL